MGRTPQLEDGYIKIAFGTFETWCCDPTIPAYWRVIYAVIRQTYGYDRKSAYISFQTFKKLTNITDKNNLYRAIRKAVEMGKLGVKSDPRGRDPQKGTKRYWYKKPFLTDEGSVVTPSVRGSNVTEKGVTFDQKSDPPPIDNKKNTEKNTQKVTKKVTKKGKKKWTVYPTWLDMKLWSEFKEHRQKLRSPMTDYAEYLAIKKLDRMCNGKMERHRDIIEQSISEGWKGLFDPKANTLVDTWKPEDER